MSDELRDIVRKYMIAECDAESDGQGLITEEQIDKQIQLGVEHYGSKSKLFNELKTYFGE